MGDIFFAPEEIIFELIQETPLENDFLSAPEENDSRNNFRNSVGNDFLSAPEEIIFEMISETPLGKNLRQGGLFSGSCQKLSRGMFFSAPQEIILEIVSETPLGNIFFLRQRT